MAAESVLRSGSTVKWLSRFLPGAALSSPAASATSSGPASKGAPREVARLTLPQVLARQAELLGERTAIREKAYGIWQTHSWNDYLAYVRKTALGLKSLGIRRGEAVALIVNNCPEWLYGELGAQSLGAVTLNLFTSSVADELRFSLGRVGAVCVIVQDQEQADKLLEHRQDLPHIRKVIYVDPTGMRYYREDPWLMSYRELLQLGEEAERSDPDLFDRELARGNSRDTALMIQTSGTTGVSKLAMLSHRGLTAMGRSWTDYLSLQPGENWISISPPAWIVDQMWGLGVALVSGMTMNFPETPETVTEDFREIGPSVLITSSRFWEDLASRIRVRMSDAGWINRLLFRWAEAAGRRSAEQESGNGSRSWSDRLVQSMAKRLVYDPLLDRIGCAGFRCVLTGGHPISPDVIRFFRAVGLNLKQCYGLTESGGIFQVQPDGEVKPETVGRPLPGTEVKIAGDSEVLVRADANFAGYYKDFAATESAFQDGWLKTGDAGYLDGDGHLVIIGRKEEIIRNKTGEAFSPDFIETRLKFSPYIKEAVIFGEGRPFLTAFVNIDFGNVGNWAEERMIPYTTYLDLSQQPEVEKLILSELREVNERLPAFMRIRKFILLYKLLDADDDELTRTGKVRRRFVYGLYLRLIEAMYRNEQEVDVKTPVRYRDGREGWIETRVRVIPVD
ncbi:MAG TPA: AMP-binding protein [Syntrophales bacterium]|nr:AMP-binding protein [Syntrophales bacterium]